MYSAAQVSPER